MDEEIAIIGIGCRVPGADNIDEFWRVLVNSENHIIDVPKERWNNDAFYSENRDEAGKTYVKKAGFIKGHDEWDNKFFGVSDNEATNVDPQQRLVLECTQMALEDAGITKGHIQKTQTGVYIGAMNEDYKGLSVFEHQDDTNYSATGLSSTIISARVSYFFDLRGPCMVLDTACSSSMIAIHLGSQAIRTGDCEMAICGGVNCMLSPGQFMTLCKAKMLSPTGQCQSFCDTADGYGRGEGCGIVIIKSYAQAVRDRNKIWGIIKTASNQDGHAAQPITAPSGEQQKELLKKVYTYYEIDPTTLQYIEAHGTGTPVGDPTEVNALGAFIAQNRTEFPIDENKSKENTTKTRMFSDNKTEHKLQTKSTILIGSVKSNIGHLESAAGVAGLIKVLLMMKHGKYVPSLHVKKDKSNINRKINLDMYGLDVSLAVAEWLPNDGGNRICCVNCFGFGGSNTHAIVIQKGDITHRSLTMSNKLTDLQYKIICISNVSTSSLKHKLQIFREDLEKSDFPLQDISFTSVFHRDHFTYRTLVFGRTPEEVQSHATRTIDNISELETKKAIKIIFVFCGVGTTWKGMCREMMSTQSTFRQMVFKIDEILRPLTGWSIAEKFQDDTDYSDPFLNHIAIFCSQIALFELWKSWGIYPKAIVGQSVGEVAAAFASGALHLEDAIQVIFHRSRILSKMTGGKMMVAGNIAIEKVETLCRKHGNRVSVAVYSSPLSGTVSGDADAVDFLKENLENLNQTTDAGIMITPLSVQCAYHSHHMDRCTDEIQSQLNNITKAERETDHYSTVTGKLAEENDFQTGKYWADNIRKPVLFMNALLKSTDQTATNVFVELGPRQVLRAHLKNILGEKIKGLCLPSMNAFKECQSIYSSLGKLYELGADINWKEVIPSEGHFVSIPRHVFQKTKVLHIPKGKQLYMKGIQQNSTSHMFLRHGTSDKAEFHLNLDKETSPFIYEHYMYNNVLVPGATYIEAAFEIGNQKSRFHVSEMQVSIEFVNALWPKDDKQCRADVKVTTKEPNELQYQITQNERVLCQGQITPRLDFKRKSFNVTEIKSRCKTLKTKDQNYECLDKLHFQYGEALRVIENSWSSAVECVVELKIPESVVEQRKVTHIHPCVIDGLFQIAGILGTTGTDGPALPKGVASFVIDRPPQQNMFGYSQLIKSSPTGNHYNFFLLCPDGHVIAQVNDFYIRKVADKTSDNVQNIRHSLIWREVTIPKETARPSIHSGKQGILAVIGSKRFISFYKHLNKHNTHFFDTETDDVFGHALNDIQNLQSILIAPADHINSMQPEGRIMFNCVKKSFLLLSGLFKLLHQKSIRKAVFVITENVIGLQRTTNVCGSELWGMVRSALIEGSATDVKLIDMNFTNENGVALQQLIQSQDHSHNEFVIENGKIHICEVLEADDQAVPLQRKIHFEISENSILKTSSSLAVESPFFDVNLSSERNITEVTQQHKIRLKEICLHDSSIFLTSLGREDDTNLAEEEQGHAVVCIEGIGSKHCNTRTNDEQKWIGFCFPVSASSIVSVPAKCTFDFEALADYVPGMFTVGVIIWNIAGACKQSKNVLCIIDDNSSLLEQLIKNLFSARTNSSLTVMTKTSLPDFLTQRQSDYYTAVILAKLSFDQLDCIATGFPTIQTVICIDGFISKRQKMLLTFMNKNMTLKIFQTENIFSREQLTEFVPQILNSFKSIKGKLKRTTKVETGVFSLPYPVLPLENKNGKACFPLIVARENVFRTNGCYIVVGGLTGLGWELVQHMANRGAKFISTFSRRRPNNHMEHELQRVWETHSCKIIPVQVDITDIGQLKNAMKKIHNDLGEQIMIRGVLHGGGVTRDKFLKDMTEEDIKHVLLPKVLGTWNLHEVTKDMELDFFIMHSSVVSVFGNQGQCNYAAGNSFQDSFAHYRRSIGLCGQSINWTALSLGMATENQLLEKYLSAQGFYYLSKDEIKECFMTAVMADESQMIFGKFDWRNMQQNQTVRLNPSKFESILKKYPVLPKYTDVHAKEDEMGGLIRKDPVQQKDVIIELIKSKIGETFVVDENTLTEETGILKLGIDSMAAMSFTNVIFDATNVRIPISTLFDESATIGSVATYIQTRLRYNAKNPQPTVQQNEERLKAYLSGDITFMQKTLLDDFVKDPFSPNIMRQVDFEIKGLEITKSDMKLTIIHLIKINPDLRRIFKIEKGRSYRPVLLDINNIDIDIKDTDFTMICQDDSADERHKIKIDITKDLPIQVMMASRKDTTRIRIYVHAVLGDLSGITNLFIDIAHILQCHFQQKQLPVKDIDLDPAEAVRRTILPRVNELTAFWKNCLHKDIEPFTLSSDINGQLEEKYWKDLSLQVPTDVVVQMINFINKQGISVYHFIISTYMVLLHEKTDKYLIPLVTFVDMRTHVKQLQPILQSCSNAIPVIGDLREMGVLSTYLKNSSHRLSEMLQHSAYPYELIQEEMISDDLRKHIGRHRFIMENMTSVRNDLTQDGVEIRIGNLFYKRHVYETTLHVEYDTRQNIVSLHFGYNGKAISDRNAERMLERMLHLITAFVQSPHKEVNALLEETSHNICSPDLNRHSNNTKDNRLNTGKELKTEVQTLSSNTTESTVDMSRQAYKREIISIAKFTKQTSKGWEHSVQLKLVRTVSPEKHRELILTWGTGRKERIIYRNHISEVEIKRTSEMVYVLVKTYARSFIFKSPSLKQAKEWLEVFKQADREVDDTNRQEMMCH